MALIAAILLVVTLALMTSGKVPAILALASALVIAGIIGIATPAELFAGLGNGSVITVAAMLVIAKGVLSTGVVSRVTHRLLAGVHAPRQALRRLIPPVGAMSALINTTPIVAMLIPATKELEQRSGIPARGVLLPIAHATTLAGSATLIGTSSNLLIAGLADSSGVTLTMFSFVPIAVPVAIIGWLVLLVAGPRMLRGSSEIPEPDWAWRAEIPVTTRARAVGQTAAALGIDTTAEFSLQHIRRWGQNVDASQPIEADDVLIYRASEDGVRMLWASPRFDVITQRLYSMTISADERHPIGDLTDNDDIMVVAAQTSEPLRRAPARPGGLCLVTAASPDTLAQHPSIGLWQELPGKSPEGRKTRVAVVILLGVIAAGTFGLASVELIASAGALLMVAIGVLTPRSAVRALNWNILAIIAGSIGLGVIVVQSGLGGYISDGVLELSGGNKILVVAVIAIATTILTNVVTNAAAAAILTPVALTIATSMDVSPVLLLTLVGTCISFTFLNPYSHQSNLMVMHPGGYSTRTFVRLGIPLTGVALVTAVAVGTTLLATT